MPYLLAKIFKRRDYYRNMNQLRTWHNKPNGGLGRQLFIKVLRAIVLPFPRSYFAEKEVANAMTYSSVKTKRVGNLLGWTPMVCEKDVFDSFINHEFEGELYKIPIGYDKWLRTYYWDYMELPPPEKRVSTHRFKAYIED